MTQRPESPGWRMRMYDIIFESDTPAGRWFDIGLLVAILISITMVSLETVPSYRARPALMSWFDWFEWLLTFLFTVEYFLRLLCVRQPMRYAFSFWGVIDLLSILPSYASYFLGSGSKTFAILRSVRLLRVFRVFKLWRMMNEADELGEAVWKSRNKIIVFLAVVLVAVTISGTLMYQIENIMTEGAKNPDGTPLPASGFTSIPQAMYWAIVTMTTVGYGDVVPRTAAGKFISAILILLGYSLIIVPSTFVSAEIIQSRQNADERRCDNCDADAQRADADYCYRCGTHFDA